MVHGRWLAVGRCSEVHWGSGRPQNSFWAPQNASCRPLPGAGSFYPASSGLSWGIISGSSMWTSCGSSGGCPNLLQGFLNCRFHLR